MCLDPRHATVAAPWEDPIIDESTTISGARGPTGARGVDRVLLDALGVATYTTDATGIITDYNEAAAELWGRRPEIGKEEWCGSWRLFWPDGTAMRHDECPMAITLKENRPVRGAEAIAERPDGSRVRFVPYPTPLRDGSGHLTGAVNVLVDITARKDAENALLAQQLRLTDALAAKDEFLGLVSHELRTPITTILGNAQVLIRGSDVVAADDRESAIRDIAGESERLRVIVDDLLVLARSEGPRLDDEPLALGRLVAQVVGEFGRKHPGLSIALDIDYAVVANGDALRTSHVLTNLLANAFRYSAANPCIEVRVVADEGDVRVHVQDRGTGILEEDYKRVFDAFYRAPSAARTTSGVGVGLTVCRRLVEAMGGSMWASGRDGGGADVGFSLPRTTASDL